MSENSPNLTAINGGGNKKSGYREKIINPQQRMTLQNVLMRSSGGTWGQIDGTCGINPCNNGYNCGGCFRLKNEMKGALPDTQLQITSSVIPGATEGENPTHNIKVRNQRGQEAMIVAQPKKDSEGNNQTLITLIY